MAEVRLAAEPRTEFGKGAARRTRRAGKIPAVLYGHGTDPQHVSLPAREFARVVREQGNNAILRLEVGAGANQLALTKTVTVHPLRQYIEHVDLLLVRRGEKVVVDVPVVVTGDPAPGTLVTQDMGHLQVEADALQIPEEFEISVQDYQMGTRVLAGEVTLPRGVELQTDPEYLVVNVSAAPTEADLEAEIDTEGAGVVEDAAEDETPAPAGEQHEAAEGSDQS
ncbi:MAG: 50S ribosomal protein L25/general stress protein Ctc [Pseudonocardiaceae bacterium]|nr:50S ribosomal protein L25/general stress protein Ctc [Pseudonocardiaceae bacterium]